MVRKRSYPFIVNITPYTQCAGVIYKICKYAGGQLWFFITSLHKNHVYAYKNYVPKRTKRSLFGAEQQFTTLQAERA